MTDHLRIALAQLNPTVGALRANLELGAARWPDAVAAKADILLFSELFLTGYFPEDLLFRPQFVDDAIAAAQRARRGDQGHRRQHAAAHHLAGRGRALQRRGPRRGRRDRRDAA